LRDGLWPVTVFYLVGWIGSGMVYSLLAQWLPTMMISAGWPSAAAQRSVTFIYGGSLAGGLALSWLMDRWRRGGVFVPAIAYGVGTILFVGLGVWLATPLVYVFLLGIGLMIGGAQYMQASLAAYVFPLKLLTISFSWIGAFARIGPVGGPLLVGWMMLEGWSETRILMVYTLIPLLSTIAFTIMAVSVTRRSRAELAQSSGSQADQKLCEATE
jgi:MFS family permease